MASQRPETPGTSKSKTPTPPPKAPEEEGRSFSDTIGVLASFATKAVVVLAVWAAGFYKFSPSWVLLAVALYVWKERQRAARKHATAIAQEIARDEKAAILARIEDLPAWVYFPDVERAEWVNKIVDQLWPYIGEYVQTLLKETIEPMIKENLPTSMDSFTFSKIDLGDIPPKIGGVKVYTSNVKRDEIYIDLEINYASDSNLSVEVKGMKFGVSDLTLRGTLRIIVRPLINKIPLIGGLSVFFLNNPEVDFNLTNLANAFDVPGLSDLLHSIIEGQIAQLMVLPNRIPIQIADDIDIQRLKYPIPQGILQVQMIEARDLVAADTQLFGRAKSDPYAIVTVGAQSRQTKVIENSIAPVWDQVFEFVVDEKEGQLLKVEVKDRDIGSKDDPLGNTTLDISVIFQKGSVEEWLPLEDVHRGVIHVRATWLYLSNNPQHFDQTQDTTKNEDILHTAILMVNLDSATSLPRGQRTLQEPSSYVLLSVGQETQESAVRASTTDPCWEQNFRFFVANPNHQSLDIEVRDAKTKKSIGELRVHLKKLMVAEDMVLQQKFPLKKAEHASALYMTVIMRILTREVTPEWKQIKQTEEHGDDHDEAGRESIPRVRRTGAPQTDDTDFPASVLEASRRGETSPVSRQGQGQTEPSVSSAASPSSTRRRKSTLTVSSSAPGRDDSGQFGLGCIQLTLRYSAARQVLMVVVHKVVNLKAAEGDSKGLADPYVTLYLLPDRDSKTKRKTDIIKKDLNPIYDVQFEYAVNASELRGKSLEVCVKNETGTFSSSQKLLGMALIDLSTLDTSRAVTQWLDLAPQDSLKPSALNYDE